ncbi:MAG: DUF1684 domain-containing protein [Saprospiraceae bacterium]|nr:DUF1684 domain-containing protein [Saprospiraceae bacterium]
MYRTVLLIILVVFISNGLFGQYYDEIKVWQKNRLQALIAEDGWATLAGLFPLRNGKQFFGSRVNKLTFPGFAADTLGEIEVSDDKVTLKVHAGVEISVNDQIISQVTLWPANEPVVCRQGRLEWFIIQRGDRFLVRLRDTDHPAREQLHSIPYYPIDSSWRLEATFHPYEHPRILPLPNALDMIIDGESPGYLTFSYRSNKYSLLTLDGGPEELFILFYDKTSGSETYGGGRYLYVKKPNSQGKTILDFNKSYSPPCAFTHFATCLLPPEENRIDLNITAGEKDPHFLDDH